MSAPDARTRGTRTSDYDFELPIAQIAQLPLERRDASRLLTVNRATGEIAHRAFSEIPTIIAPGDALVLNTTKVMRARLLGTRDSGAPAEILLLRPLADGTWEAMVSPGGKLHPGRHVRIADGFDAEIVALTDRRTRIVRLRAEGDVGAAIERHGHIPLPPYIARADTAADAERYQTVYARENGSVAAPTAGLHMTDALLAALAARGVRRVDLVLHVGAGTFKPVEVEDPAFHPMHEESFELSAESAAALDDARARGGKIWALGTTSARALESAVREDGSFAAARGETRLFVRPPYTFRGVDKLITNFHLPRSTLLMLVAALAGYDLTMRAYGEAVDAGYRFYSYGDAMAVI
ncbi:MAG TPA: tRNA preQ1(34) S-adenosylmethionine ribosyltransferase-isomerase QueA [Gemmatimonadaceae bacterium]|nr:tRNA preQ1(34) S-adenosylmethionine ribosyltransferase-isomerase QueA [Gemmatimonadaceae bacterium]